MKDVYLYEFIIKICGFGSNSEEAWENCKENFDIDDEPLPENGIIAGKETP